MAFPKTIPAPHRFPDPARLLRPAVPWDPNFLALAYAIEFRHGRTCDRSSNRVQSHRTTPFQHSSLGMCPRLVESRLFALQEPFRADRQRFFSQVACTND